MIKSEVDLVKVNLSAIFVGTPGNSWVFSRIRSSSLIRDKFASAVAISSSASATIGMFRVNCSRLPRLSARAAA